jgi:RasGEF domain
MLVEKFAQFVHDVMSRYDAKLSESLKTNLMQKQKGIQRRFSQAMFSKPAPAPFYPKAEVTSILDVNPQEIARQLTLIDYNLCRAIEPQECIGCAWTKDNKNERSPNLLKMINRFNAISLWVSVMLVSEPILRKRIRFMTHLLSVFPYLRELNNFGAIFQLIGGFGNSAVYRLAKTFEGLDPRKRKILDEMRVLCKPDQSWKNYRGELHGANPPCVPFVGVYQTDLTFIEDGNPSKFASGLINFKKCRLIASVISEIQQYQQKPYNLTAVQPVYDFLQSTLPDPKDYSDKRLYELSLAAEPRATA